MAFMNVWLAKVLMFISIPMKRTEFWRMQSRRALTGHMYMKMVEQLELRFVQHYSSWNGSHLNIDEMDHCRNCICLRWERPPGEKEAAHPKGCMVLFQWTVSERLSLFSELSIYFVISLLMKCFEKMQVRFQGLWVTGSRESFHWITMTQINPICTIGESIKAVKYRSLALRYEGFNGSILLRTECLSAY